ncbi:hypothetical protein QJQ45_026292, partial [Haematococcus lacustris]
MLSSNIVLPPSPNWYGAHLVAVQPALHLVAYAGHSSVVVACSRTQRVLRTMCAGTSRVTALAFAPWPLFSGTQLVAGHEDGSLRCWDSTSGACLRSHRKKAHEVSALAMLHRLPGQVVVGDVKGGLLLWHFTNGSKPTALDLRLPSKVMCLLAWPSPAGPQPLHTQSGTHTSSRALQSSTDSSRGAPEPYPGQAGPLPSSQPAAALDQGSSPGQPPPEQAAASLPTDSSGGDSTRNLQEAGTQQAPLPLTPTPYTPSVKHQPSPCGIELAKAGTSEAGAEATAQESGRQPAVAPLTPVLFLPPSEPASSTQAPASVVSGEVREAVAGLAATATDVCPTPAAAGAEAEGASSGPAPGPRAEAADVPLAACWLQDPVAVAGQDGAVYVVDVSAGRLLCQWVAHKGPVNSLGMQPASSRSSSSGGASHVRASRGSGAVLEDSSGGLMLSGHCAASNSGC